MEYKQIKLVEHLYACRWLIKVITLLLFGHLQIYTYSARGERKEEYVRLKEGVNKERETVVVRKKC